MKTKIVTLKPSAFDYPPTPRRELSTDVWKHCWHGPCRLLRKLANRRVFIVNQAGFARAAYRREVETA